jgi:CubicO group peptidase (beta-lactamase class C family)
MSEFQDLIVERLEARINAGAMSAAAVRVERRGEVLLDWAGGTREFDLTSSAVDTNDVFHVASISKPMVTSGFALLIERGLVDADDPVADYVPEFAANGKGGVTLRHLLTHSSGLSDMVPGNIKLRKRNAPLSDFVAAACGSELLFAPGTDVRYQSSGILMLAEIAERVLGVSYRDHLANEVFEPAGMDSTHLGWRSEYENRAVHAKTNMTNLGWRSGDAVNSEAEDTSSWNHNSPYWRDIGSPWGGVHTNTLDIARLLQVLLNGGLTASGEKVFEPGTVRMLLSDHTSALPDLSEATRLREGWGFGWRIQRLGDGWVHGSAVPAGAFGHYGSTGTVTWADPASGVVFVLLTNGLAPAEGAALKACGNIAATALCGG